MTAARPNFRKRGYTTRWDKAAANFRRQHPYCLGCQAIGRVMPTELVDHVEPHKGDQSKFWNTALWQPSCRWHHDVIKKQLEALFERGECTLADLWLSSALGITLSRKRPPPQTTGADGWPMG